MLTLVAHSYSLQNILEVVCDWSWCQLSGTTIITSNGNTNVSYLWNFSVSLTILVQGSYYLSYSGSLEDYVYSTRTHICTHTHTHTHTHITQLMANMTETVAEVAWRAVVQHKLFQTITVYGLLVDNSKNAAKAVRKMTVDYSKQNTFMECADDETVFPIKVAFERITAILVRTMKNRQNFL